MEGKERGRKVPTFTLNKYYSVFNKAMSNTKEMFKKDLLLIHPKMTFIWHYFTLFHIILHFSTLFDNLKGIGFIVKTNVRQIPKLIPNIFFYIFPLNMGPLNMRLGLRTWACNIS